ncbi:CAAX geranylgeranyltransferase alpha subunit [Mycoemilia scoparia]|uniref:Protein farnesyltransferase/geranylgeranyltransferase type-1 subunit alpha n=1 Tax=Mycoemilia scoparia TaxID=417184 RepID=A0A9W8DUI3_9FUNG|nr:CAAX geranylgeranyltransferase alpha subunit [Mycoemilia scoparia]
MDEDWVPYNQREEWKDIIPMNLPQEPQSVCAIAYDEKYATTMSYFRAIIHKKELSERAWEITNDAIMLNSGHYTAWVFRLKLFHELKKDGKKEIEWLNEMAEDHPKTYQLWHHRESIIKALCPVKQDAETDTVNPEQKEIIAAELWFLLEAITADPKNFHAWQWLVKRYALWTQELQFVESRINNDVRNNSAWNQRYFVLTKGQGDAKLDSDVIEKEIEYSIDKIRLAPSNESPWSYICGLLRKFSPAHITTKLHPIINDLANDESAHEGQAMPVGQLMKKSPHYWAFLIDIYEIRLEDLKLESSRDTAEIVQSATEACDMLAQSIDPIRFAYWNYRKQAFVL